MTSFIIDRGSVSPVPTPDSITDALTSALDRQILVIDGAMGTMIQARELAETDFRGRELRRFSVTASLSGVAFFERLGYQTVARLLHETQGGVKIGMWDMEKLP